jgi:hypothetical protein
MPYGSRTATSRRALRYRLTLLLHGVRRPLTIAEMVRHLEAIGWPAPDPAAKSVADSLRWEIGHHRVVRVARGRYAARPLDRRTVWWMRRQLQDWEAVERLSETPDEGRPLDAPIAPTWLTALHRDPTTGGPVERVSECEAHPQPAPDRIR